MRTRRKAIGAVVGVLALGGVACGATPAGSGDPAPSVELVRGLIDAERFEQAVTVLKRLDADGGADGVQIGLLFGRIYLAIGRPAKALGFFEEASFASIDGEAEATLGMAEAELALGDLAKARRDADLVLRADPDLTAAHLVLARADQRIGKAAEAAARLRRLQRSRPDSEDVAIILARYLAEQDGPEAGVDELRRFVARYPGAAGAQDVLGQLLWATGRKSEAVRARLLARQLYRDRGQAGRAEAMSAWLEAVAPHDEAPKAMENIQPQPPAREPPPPRAAPRPRIEAAPLPPPARPEPIVAALLPHPEPLPFPPGSPIMTGSGIVLEGGRRIITNRHVVEGSKAIAVRNGTGHVRQARLVKAASDDDLALLEIDDPFPEGAVMPLADIVEPAPGRAAIVMGYPMISVFGDEQPALTDGIVAKTNGLADDPTTFEMTAKMNKGNSGGPVFDRRGHLIGVAVGKVDAAAVHQANGAAIEDLNLGIKGGRILRFLGRPPAAEAQAPDMSLEELYQRMLPRTVLIAAQK